MSNVQELRGYSSSTSEKILEEEPYPCPFASAHCQWKGALKADVMNHLEKEHKSVPTFQGEQITFLPNGIDHSGQVGWVMRQKCFEADFILALIKHGNPHLYGFVQFIGSKKEAQEFVYKLQLSGKDGISKAWEATPRSLHEGNGFGSDCLTLTKEEAITFSENAKLGIQVTITRNVLKDTIEQIEAINLNDDETKKPEQEEPKLSLNDAPSDSEVDNIAMIDSLNDELDELMEAKHYVEAENIRLKMNVQKTEDLVEELKLMAFNKQSEYCKIENQNKQFFARILSLEQQVKLDNELAKKLKKDVEKAERKLSDANKSSEIQIITLTRRLQDAQKILGDMRKKVSTDTKDNEALKKKNMDLITANEELVNSNTLLNISMDELKGSLHSSRTFYDMEVERSQQTIQTMGMYLDNAKSQIRRMTENAEIEAKCNEELKVQIEALNQKIGNMEQSHKSADELARTQQQTLTVAIKYLTDQMNKISEDLKTVLTVKENYQHRMVELSQDLKELELKKKTDQEALMNDLECREVEGVLLRNRIVCLKKDLKDSKAAAEKEMEEMRKKLSAQSEMLSEIQLKMDKEKEEKDELVQDGYEVFMF